MKKIYWFIVVGSVWASMANAHGPVRQKLIETIKINASPATVWERINEFGDMSWLPNVEKTDSDGGHEKGATRVLTLKDGTYINEELKKYNADKMEYKYKITDMSTLKTLQHLGKGEPVKVLPVSNYSASIAVKPTDGGSEVTWKAAYYRAYMNNDPPAGLNEDAANKAVKGVLQAGLTNLKNIIEKK